MSAASDSEPSFFKQFSADLILEKWSSAATLLDLAQSLGFSDPAGLKRVDYQFIEELKNRNVWRTNIVAKHRKLERTRHEDVKALGRSAFETAASHNGIETLSHLSLHFLLSPKHGRKVVRERILTLKIDVGGSLYKGVHGVSKTPMHWPTPYYEKRIGAKPQQCTQCGFKATKPQQIELHHLPPKTGEPLTKGTLEYYRAKDLKPLCANCHSLEHRTGEHLLDICGIWHTKNAPNRKHKNPGDIFCADCADTYRVQKNYFLKWHLRSPSQYQCEDCGAVHWDPKNGPKQLLSLELHHKDGNQTNSLLSNLQLLCPNCHRSK